jgi:hypothetical protein
MYTHVITVPVTQEKFCIHSHVKQCRLVFRYSFLTLLLLLSYTYRIIDVCLFSGSAAQRGLWLPRPRGFLITHNDAP